MKKLSLLLCIFIFTVTQRDFATINQPTQSNESAPIPLIDIAIECIIYHKMLTQQLRQERLSTEKEVRVLNDAVKNHNQCFKMAKNLGFKKDYIHRLIKEKEVEIQSNLCSEYFEK